MEINITGHHIEITPAIKTFTQEKFQKLLHHFDKITAVHVTFNVEKFTQIAEAHILIAKGDINARAEAQDLYAAIDLLIEKLDKQLVKFKEKHNHHRE